MAEQVEISRFDLRFEGCRLRNSAAEKILLASILENGIRDPLQGVDNGNIYILLDGFKRYRCSKKLGIGIVPYCRLSTDAAIGIIELLRMSNAKSLSILEQAKLIDELKNVYHMSTADIAGLLEKSKSWVSVRSGIVNEMSELVMTKIFCGQFPVYAYMYILRPFIRINAIKREDIDEFVGLVSGKNLSIRNIQRLAAGYFKGSDQLRTQIKKGDIVWALASLDDMFGNISGCTPTEQAMLKNLELAHTYMNRVIIQGQETGFKTGAFFAQADMLSGAMLRQMDMFDQTIRQIHDRCTKA